MKSRPPLESKQSHVTLIGDSTLDNTIWVGGGPYVNAILPRLGIKRDKTAVRIQKSHRRFCKTELSVVENLSDLLLANYAVHDYTNDGFTTKDVLEGALKDKVFPTGVYSLYPNENFSPLEEGVEAIKKSTQIIVSVGGNDFREFLQSANSGDRRVYIEKNFDTVFTTLCQHYLAIISKIRTLNPDARIILMTQYYPSASQNTYGIYEFMREIGRVKKLGGEYHNPMTVIQEIMKRTYTDVLNNLNDKNVVVADITSSLNPYDSKNYVSQIEPSGQGGKKIAQMLQYVMTSEQITPGHAYRFFPEFFTVATEQEKHVEATKVAEWKPAHPYDLRTGYTLEEEEIYRNYRADEILSDQLLNDLDFAIFKHELKSSLHKAGLKVKQASEKITDFLEADLKKWKMSIVLTINLLKNSNDPKAIRLLEANAMQRALGKGDGWAQLRSALVGLVGVAILGLSIAGLPFTGGTSLWLMYAAGGLLTAAGLFGIHRNRQQSQAKELAALANKAARLPRV